MITEAIKYLQCLASDVDVNKRLEDVGLSADVLFVDGKPRSLREYQESPPDTRRVFKTHMLADANAYLKAEADQESIVTIDRQSRTATVYIDGDSWGRHRVEFMPEVSAAMRSVNEITDTNLTPKALISGLVKFGQKVTAVRVEDDGSETPMSMAIVVQTLRQVKTIDTKERESTTHHLSEREALSRARGFANADKLPTHFYFTVAPYSGFSVRQYALEMSLGNTEHPTFTLSVIDDLERDEAIESELVDELLRDLSLAVYHGSLRIE